MIQIEHLDHLVLTVADIQKTCSFYHDILGFEIITFGTGRKALKYGNQKFNLHETGHEFTPKAAKPTAGSADFCLIATTPLEDVIADLNNAGISIEEGPIERTGANGPIKSVYIRDPDKNLVEISNYTNHI